MASSPAAPTGPSVPSASSKINTELDENSNDCKYFHKDGPNVITKTDELVINGNPIKCSILEGEEISKFHVDEKPRKLQRGRDNHGNSSEDEYNYENYDDDDDGDYEVNPDDVEKEYLKHLMNEGMKE